MLTEHSLPPRSLAAGGRAWLLRSLVAALVLVMAVTVGAVPVQASHVYVDRFDFEGADASQWSFYHFGSGLAALVTDPDLALGGNNSGVVASRTQYASAQKTLTWPNAHTCFARVWLNNAHGVDGFAAKVNLEVINPSTWSYISLRTRWVDHAGYGAYGFQQPNSTWNPPGNTFVVRISVEGNGSTLRGVRLDELTVSCQHG